MWTHVKQWQSLNSKLTRLFSQNWSMWIEFFGENSQNPGYKMAMSTFSPHQRGNQVDRAVSSDPTPGGGDDWCLAPNPPPEWVCPKWPKMAQLLPKAQEFSWTSNKLPNPLILGYFRPNGQNGWPLGWGWEVRVGSDWLVFKSVLVIKSILASKESFRTCIKRNPLPSLIIVWFWGLTAGIPLELVVLWCPDPGKPPQIK